MKRISTVLFVALITTLCACGKSPKIQAEVVDRPDITITNVSYVGNRSPLQPLNFIKLPVGDVQPGGWLHRYLILQKEGLTGHLGEISSWLDKNNNAWMGTGGDHGWEEVPYWLKGYSSIAYILNDQKMIDETKTWLEAVFASQTEDGYFGPVNEWWGKRELWANMIMLWILQSYYEYSGDQRVIELMTNYFKWQMTVPDDQFLEQYWENSRGGDNLYSVLWLYNITGDKFLLEMAEKTHRNTADWTHDSQLPNWHNVNVAQSFREPATYYMLSGDSSHLVASYNAHNLVRRTFGQVPGGMFGADENARMGFIDPRQGTETCGFVEQMTSDEIMLRISGDPFWAENAEDVAFNSFPAAVTPDFKSLRYITSPNHTISDSDNHAPGIQNNGPFLNMNPFSSRCCQHNHTQGWPYYVENLVLATPDNGVGIALYGECTAKVKVGAQGEEITLVEETKYPFEESVKFTIKTDGKTIKFPVYLRIPSWVETVTASVNGKKAKTASPSDGKYIRLTGEWKDGDVITLSLPMHILVREWQVNKNSVSVDYGPLTFSLLIDEDYKRVGSAETAIHDSKWQSGVDVEQWPTWEIYPASPWNYALQVDVKNPASSFKIERRPWPSDDFPFTNQASPIVLTAKGRKVPSWKIDQYGITGVLPNEDAPQSDTLEDIKLVPMGGARLRISSFPQTNK